MRTARVRIVQQRNIAGIQPQRLHGRSHRSRHRPQMHRHVVAHRQRIPGRVENRTGVVPPLLDIRRKCRPPQRRPHLLRHRMEEPLEYLQPRRIEPPRPHPAVSRVLFRHAKFIAFSLSYASPKSSRFSKASTEALHPCGTTVVALYSATIAGPRNRFPGRSFSL